jgi:hypothetical protein
MAKKNRFPPEADTQPDMKAPRAGARTSGPAPKSKREGAEAPTLPPPKSRRATEKPAAARNSGIKARKPEPSDEPGATVDEVTADLSKDPRRERE